MARGKKTEVEVNPSPSMDDLLKMMRKEFGADSIMTLVEAPPIHVTGVVPTGSLRLDLALGVGGLPYGRIVEIFGAEGAGKTTLALSVIANAQKQLAIANSNKVAAFIDAEHAIDPEYASRIGVDLAKIAFSQPDDGDQAIDIVQALVKSNGVSVVVVDSVAALVSLKELEGDVKASDTGGIAPQARLMSQALRRLAGEVKKHNVCLIFINQMRNMGFKGVTFSESPGGRALKYWASVRIALRAAFKIESPKDNQIGIITNAEIKKNKVAVPFKKTQFEIYFGDGISREADIIELGCQLKILEQSGAWIKDPVTGEQIGQGKEKARSWLEEHPDIAAAYEERIKKELNLETFAMVPTENPDITDEEEDPDDWEA